MKLTWYGHACFMLETDRGSLVFDPYAPGSVPGLELPQLTADMVICSHEHSDHYCPQGVKLSGRKPGFSVKSIAVWHDDKEGALRGKNLVSCVEDSELRLVHLGDLGHMLSPGQIEELGSVDILLIPVGGFYTIDAQTAWKLVQAIKPRITIPMHYRGPGFGFDNIAPVEDFLKLAEKVEYLDTNVLETPFPTEASTVCLRCPVWEE